jgi:hypothetical protein
MAALRHLEQGHARGKVIITVGDNNETSPVGASGSWLLLVRRRIHTVTEPVTCETEYWKLSLPPSWRHHPTNDEDCFAVKSDDGTNKIFAQGTPPLIGFPGRNTQRESG